MFDRPIVGIGQLVAAAVIAWAGVTKLLATPGNVFIFQELGMEPFGRHLVGVIEIGAGLLLLTRGFAALGALLTVGIMFGAIIAHVTFLGVDVQGDGGTHTLLLVAVLLSAGFVLFSRRRDLPLIGETL